MLVLAFREFATLLAVWPKLESDRAQVLDLKASARSIRVPFEVMKYSLERPRAYGDLLYEVVLPAGRAFGRLAGEARVAFEWRGVRAAAFAGLQDSYVYNLTLESEKLRALIKKGCANGGAQELIGSIPAAPRPKEGAGRKRGKGPRTGWTQPVNEPTIYTFETIRIVWAVYHACRRLGVSEVTARQIAGVEITDLTPRGINFALADVLRRLGKDLLTKVGTGDGVTVTDLGLMVQVRLGRWWTAERLPKKVAVYHPYRLEALFAILDEAFEAGELNGGPAKPEPEPELEPESAAQARDYVSGTPASLTPLMCERLLVLDDILVAATGSVSSGDFGRAIRLKHLNNATALLDRFGELGVVERDPLTGYRIEQDRQVTVHPRHSDKTAPGGTVFGKVYTVGELLDAMRQARELGVVVSDEPPAA